MPYDLLIDTYETERIKVMGAPVASLTGSPVRHLRAPVAFGVVLLAILTGTLVLATFRLRPAAVAATERRLRQFTFQSGLQKSPTWSPDGRAVAFTSDRAGNSDLWVQPVNGPQAMQLTTSTANESEPDWSPDGQSLVFRSESDGGGLLSSLPRVVPSGRSPASIQASMVARQQTRAVLRFGASVRYAALSPCRCQRGAAACASGRNLRGRQATSRRVAAGRPRSFGLGARRQRPVDARHITARWRAVDEVIPLAGRRTTLLEFGRALRPVRLGPIRHAPLFRRLLSGNPKPVESHRRP